jgi:ferredoxin
MTFPTRVALLGVLGLVAAGCGSDSGDPSASTTTVASTRTVDDQQVEQDLRQDLSTSAAEVTKVSCPGDVPVAQGDTFTCSVSFSTGATGTATVTQQGANRYTYELEEGSVRIPGSEVEQQIQKDLSAQDIPNATVNCPETIIVRTGTTVTCDVSSASGMAAGTVTFAFSSAEGTVDPSSVESG